jgi:hypothetical protein
MIKPLVLSFAVKTKGGVVVVVAQFLANDDLHVNESQGGF